jgi:hypothetical protein
MFGPETTVLALLACLTRDPKDCHEYYIAAPSMSLKQCRELAEPLLLRQWLSYRRGVTIKKWVCELPKDIRYSV